MSKYRLFVGIFVIFLGIFYISPIYAQNTIGPNPHQIADYMDINASSVPDGSIVSHTINGMILSQKEYDPTLIGVVTKDPMLAIETVELATKEAVITNGVAYVRVSAQNGTIQAGDAITTSTTEGVGMKADKPGYIIGFSLDSYESKNPQDTNRIRVEINKIYYSKNETLSSSLNKFVSSSIATATQDPLSTFKYFIAGTVLLTTLFVGIFFFGRAVNSGIDAMGRNPLAKNHIYVIVLYNIFLSVFIIGTGFAIAISILKI
ncbi:MAG: hypothetical protein WCO06_05310 [Candidatus Roizmanbacteria bacterium]